MPTLDTLPEGARARIRNVTGEDAISVRLMEMGVLDGEEVFVVGAAPLGDPVEYEIRGYRLSLRKAEARRVEIELPG
jgi:ferrous iron transport protein A